MICRLVLALVAGLGVMPAAAQSIYGCTDLDDRHGLPSVEGDNGVFYRIDPDLRMFHPVSDDSIARLRTLSSALANLGTTLIYVPMPTKSLVMPNQLPQAALDHGFDVSIATTVHDDILRRLRLSGIVTADVRSALRVGPDMAPSVFPTDYRLTAAGADRAARAIAEAMGNTAGFADLPKGRFASTITGQETLPSAMRAALQRHCQITLPELVVDSYALSRVQGQVAASDTNLLADAVTSARVAVVGTEHVGTTSSNFAGALAAASRLDVQQYTVDAGGSFAAISSYLTSRAFQDQRPAYLIWINPVENNLAIFGDQPMRELAAAAGGNCRVPLPATPAVASGAVTAELSALDPAQPYTIYIDAEGTPALRADFAFMSSSGLLRTRTVQRHPGQVATGRFYMPLTGLWPEGATNVTITLDVAPTVPVRVTACLD